MLTRLLLILFIASGLCAPARAADEKGAAQNVREAVSAMQRSDFGQAASLYGEALADTSLTNERRATILNDRGVALSRLGQTKLAIEDFNRAIQLLPEYAAIYNNRGGLLLSVGLTREALKDFDRALLLAPGYTAAYNNRANAHMQLGNAQDAIRDYTKAIELVPASAAPLSGRGRAHLAQQRPHAAIRDFTRAINSDARFASGYRSRAEAKMAIDRYDDAIEDYSRAIAFDVNNGEVYILRGEAYLKARNVANALKDFSRAVELDGRSSTALLARGHAYGLADAIDDALADFNRAIEIEPRSAVAFAYRGWIYKLAGQVDIGMKDVQTALKLDAARAEVHWAKAEIEAELGRKEQAVEDLRRALQLRPGYRDAIDSLARLGFQLADQGEKVVTGAGVDRWQVVIRGGRHFAVHDDYPRLAVPLEMAGAGEPKLLDWELRAAPLKGIGALRFYAGTVEGKQGPEEIEQVAIVDLPASSVVAIEPHRQGGKVATWTWDEGKVTVASVDGVKDEFVLRDTKPKEQAAAQQPKRAATSTSGSSGWAPWSQPWGGGGSSSGSKSKGKPKTIFDMLFN